MFLLSLLINFNASLLNNSINKKNNAVVFLNRSVCVTRLVFCVKDVLQMLQ